MQGNRIYVAVPAMDEPGLPEMLLSLNYQEKQPEAVYVCINQPRSYYSDEDPGHKRIIRSNAQVYSVLTQMKEKGSFLYRLELIDRFTPDYAWDEKHLGVGWARKTAMDAAMTDAWERFGKDADGILACMDADTFYPSAYLKEMDRMFLTYPKAVGMANPYYHQLKEEGKETDEEQDKAILHYEVYMRSYLLQMMLHSHPYAFTAVGSSMASTWKAYRKIGGISPFKSGEDFYFLQKLLKTGSLIVHSPVCSHPSSRLSTRVFFGTGPALNKGLRQDWKSYPIYPARGYKLMADAYRDLPLLFNGEETDAVRMCFTSSFGEGWYLPIRKHCGNRQSQFVKSCIEKFDALRSLQFLKSSYQQDDVSDWTNLKELCRVLLDMPEVSLFDGSGNGDGSGDSSFCQEGVFSRRGEMARLLEDTSVCGLSGLSLQDWILIRDFLFLCERKMQMMSPLLPCW